ncbi:MAG: Serine/threonine kinase [Labilithrix sp.]|nr:Serine/threonine kinase [Labilithrix sp.]
MRARILFAIPIALMIACSLAVDTSGLSDPSAPASSLDGAAPETSTGDGAAIVEAGDGSSSAGDGGDAATVCPTGRGPNMVRITDANGAFCIDSTEVTQAQFNVFIADTARPTPPNVCTYRTTYGGAMRANDALPVVDVDWCEAWMFCKWAGKRLCGSRNGVVINDFGPASNAQVSEWFAACSHSGTNKYPYGDTSTPTTCNSCDRTGSCMSNAPRVPVASLAGCQGGYPGIFDMTGNVAEWEDDCDVKGTAPENDQCPPRGKDTSSAASNSTCAISELPSFNLRQQANAVTGIRCCAN